MKILRNRHFWLILALFLACSIFHYIEQISGQDTDSSSLHFGLSRHALGRLLFLLPIGYCGFVFGRTWGFITSLSAALVMLPRAIFISDVPRDSLLEIAGVLVIGVVECQWLWVIAKEKESYRVAVTELESANQLLQEYFESARSNEKRLFTLNAISNVLTESLELENVLRRAAGKIIELMGVEIIRMYCISEETQELLLVAYEGISAEFAREVEKIKIGERFNGEVARTGVPIVVEDASTDPRLTNPELEMMNIKAQLIVPVTLRNKIIGTLCVSMHNPRQFLPGEVELLSAVASQIGSTFENARLYERERLTAQRLATSERDYREIFENASDSIWVQNLSGEIIVANKATELLTGYSAEELTGMNAISFLPEEDYSLAGQVRGRLVENKPVAQPFEQHLIRKDGTEAILMLTTNLKTENGNPVAFQCIARDVTEERRMQNNMHYYLKQITRAQEDERKRIARELHDDTSQVLYSLYRQLDNFLRINIDLKPDQAGFLKELRQQLNDALEGVKRFSQALRPPMLDDLGLLSAVRWLVNDMERYMGFEVCLKVSGKSRRLSEDAELTLFRAIQEALRNVWKHASATKVEVAIEFFESKIRVSIIDNGIGFEHVKKTKSISDNGRLGIIGIEERMRLLGGNLMVQSEPGKGTSLIAEVPI